MRVGNGGLGGDEGVCGQGEFVVVWCFEERVGDLTRLQIAEPNGVLAFLPVVDAGRVVPPEFESRTVEVSDSLK